MTLVQKSSLLAIYVDPGSDYDGYSPPRWRVHISPTLWEGGGGEWMYIYPVGDGTTANPDRAYLFNRGAGAVSEFRQWFHDRGATIQES